MRKYNNYHIDNNYPKTPAIKSVLIMVPALLFLLILFTGVFFYTLLSGKYWAAIIVLLFFLMNVMYLEFIFTKNLCMGQMDVWREETRLGDFKGNLYQANTGASVFSSYMIFFILWNF